MAGTQSILLFFFLERGRGGRVVISIKEVSINRKADCIIK